MAKLTARLSRAYASPRLAGARQPKRKCWHCFEDFGEDAQAYGYSAGFGLTESCEREVLDQLEELQRKASEYARLDGRVAEDELFFAEQNARLIKNAEQYYRTMFSGRVSSWNLRDRHMSQFLLRLRDGEVASKYLGEPRLERAIGVIYRPETERISHYFYARLADQFDAVLHFDQTRAVEPLERTVQWERGELPETYPVGV